MADSTFILEWLYLRTDIAIIFKELADANDDGFIGGSDAMAILGFLFLGNPPTLPPLP
jgi:hypothetical protein